jgi:hypothetical protein
MGTRRIRGLAGAVVATAAMAVVATAGCVVDKPLRWESPTSPITEHGVMGPYSIDACLDPAGSGDPGDVVLTISQGGETVTSLRKQARDDGSWYVEWWLPQTVTPGEYDFDAVCLPRGADTPTRPYEHHTLSVAKDWLDMEWTGLPAVVAPGQSMTGSSIEKCPPAAEQVLWEMGHDGVMVGYGFFPVTDGDWTITIPAPTTAGSYGVSVMCSTHADPGNPLGQYTPANFTVG